MNILVRLILICAATAFASAAFAHKPSDSYLTLRVGGRALDGRWDLALRDLEAVFELDRNHDGRIDWGEVRTRLDDIDAYALRHLTLARGGEACVWRAADHQIDRHSDGAYLVLFLAGECVRPGRLDVGYSLLFDVDAQHRGLLRLESREDAAAASTAVFSTDARSQSFDLGRASAWTSWRGYVRDGIAHIAEGYDHILFLVALLLPAVLGRSGRADGARAPAPELATFWSVAKTVTAFTLAHSLTLAAAACGVIALPARLTESMIALSIVLTAADNLVPILPPRRWIVAFVFGLIHGFGFAAVLIDLDLPRSALALALFGFNLGVEVGQLVLVALLVPLACLARGTLVYRSLALRVGSAAIGMLALGWLAERSLDLKLLPF